MFNPLQQNLNAFENVVGKGDDTSSGVKIPVTTTKIINCKMFECVCIVRHETEKDSVRIFVV